jgi:hypothetical protein
MKNALKRLFKRKIIIILLLFVFVPPLLFIYLILENTPASLTSKVVDADDARRAKETIKRSLKPLRYPSDSATIIVNEEDLNAIMAFISRGVKSFSGQVEIGPWGMHSAMALHIPHNPVGDYINVRFGLEPSDSGLKIFQVSLGKIKIPGRIALPMLRIILNMVLDEDGGTAALKAVKSVNIEGKKVTLTLQPVPDFKLKLAKYKNLLKDFRDEVALLGDPNVVRIYYKMLEDHSRIYYKMLEDLSKDIPKSQPVSLASFMGPLFRMAKDRSDYKLTEPADENQAALLALVMFFGTHRFESLIGPVRTEEMKLQHRRPPNAVLGDRKDLRLHFLISAGIKIISDKGITYTVGEFKELLDSGQGGSDFSFADLAADRAGLRFAEVAVDRSGGALKLQRLLSENAGEGVFFPNIVDLPEGLSQEQFENLYENIEARPYLNMINKIDTRINQLPLYIKDMT